MPMSNYNKATSSCRLLLLGSTGAVGQQVLRLAVANPHVATVIAPTRRVLDRHGKLVNPITDFSALSPDSDWWQVDAVICTLGTTIGVAGSQAAFAAVDRDLPILIAAHARRAGAGAFALNSSLGASLTGNFYLRTKAEAEAGIRALAYPSYTIVRPSLIDAERNESRPGERLGLAVAGVLRPLIPRRYRPVSAAAIAVALLKSALDARPGEHIIESDAIGNVDLSGTG
jgi:uncharacterized protein YbjT (DUF2867 family)